MKSPEASCSACAADHFTRSRDESEKGMARGFEARIAIGRAIGAVLEYEIHVEAKTSFGSRADFRSGWHADRLQTRSDSLRERDAAGDEPHATGGRDNLRLH